MDQRRFEQEHVKGTDMLFLCRKYTGIAETDIDPGRLDIESFLCGDSLYGFPYREEVIEKLTEDEAVPESPEDMAALFSELFEDPVPAGGTEEASGKASARADAEALLFLRLCWFKTFYPQEFYAAVFSVFRVYCDLDYGELAGGKRKIEVHVRELDEYGRAWGFSEENGDMYMKDEAEILRLALECRKTGIGILPPDINYSEPSQFSIEKDGIRIPFDIHEELLQIHAGQIRDRRKKSLFSSEEELRTFLPEADLQILRKNHALECLDGRKRHAFRWIGDVIGEMDNGSCMDPKPVIDRADGNDEAAGSGFSELDQALGGFLPGRLCYVFGRPCIGKTVFLLNVARWVAGKQKKPVWYVCIDQSTGMTVSRIVSQAIETGAQKVQRDFTREIRREGMDPVRARLRAMPLYLCEEFSDLAELENAVREEVREGILIIDHLDVIGISDDPGLRKDKYESLKKFTEELNRRLKRLAEEMNLPVIAAASVSRKVEARADKHPAAGDCPGLLAGEQYVDSALALYREAYYDPEADRDTMEAVLLKGPGKTGKKILLSYNEDTGVLRERNQVLKGQ